MLYFKWMGSVGNKYGLSVSYIWMEEPQKEIIGTRVPYILMAQYEGATVSMYRYEGTIHYVSSTYISSMNEKELG